MPRNQSSASDLEAAVERLAHTAAIARTFGPMEKAALPSLQDVQNFVSEQKNNLSQYVQKGKEHFQQNPGHIPLAMAGAGALGGGALGFGAGMMGDKEHRQPWNNALTGAIAGGALVGGAGLAMQHGAQAASPPPPVTNAYDKLRKATGSNWAELFGALPDVPPGTQGGLIGAGLQGTAELGAKAMGRSSYDPIALREGMKTIDPKVHPLGHLDQSQLNAIKGQMKNETVMRGLLSGKQVMTPKGQVRAAPSPKAMGPHPETIPNLARDLTSTMDDARPTSLTGAAGRWFRNRPAGGFTSLPRGAAYLGAPIGGALTDVGVSWLKDWQQQDAARRGLMQALPQQ